MLKRCPNCFEEYLSGIYHECPKCGYDDNVDPGDTLYMKPGTELAERYIIGKTLGIGGFGITYMAWDSHLSQKVAIKEYLPSEFSTRIPGHTHITVFSGDKSEQFFSGMSKFIDEAKNLARFQNVPGIVKVYDTFEANLTAYIVMELLEGETLKDRLDREGTIPSDEAFEVITKILEALKIIHDNGMLHRDIAPDNIFLTNGGQPKLIDFGAARYATTTRSRSITVIIKPGYSPEEQYRSKGDQGPYTDVYAIGATLYRTITGLTPPDALKRRAFLEEGRKDPLIKLKSTRRHHDQFFYDAVTRVISVYRKLYAGAAHYLSIGMKWLAPKLSNIRKMSKWLTDRSESTDAVSKNADPDYFVSKTQATAIMNAMNIQIADRTPDVQTFLDELKTEDKVPKRESSISPTDYLGLLRLRSASIAAVALCAVIFVLSFAGVFRSPEDRSIKIPDNMTRVPQIVNTDIALAGKALEEASLLYQITSNEHSDIIPEDRLLSQSISGGSIVGKNTIIEVVMSVGDRTETVPNVIGYHQDTAAGILGEIPFSVEYERIHSQGVKEGCVIKQSVQPGSDNPINDTIVLTVSDGYAEEPSVSGSDVVVPELKGKSFDEAIFEAEKSGFVVAVVNKQFSDEYPENAVISSSPSANERIGVKGTVELVLSLGEEKYKVPDIVYMSEEEAVSAVQRKNLTYSTVHEYSTNVAKGLVIRQTPQARSWVKPWTEIQMVISDGLPPFPMPDLKGMTEDKARQTLVDAGLAVNVNYAKSREIPEGTLISQSVNAGDDITVGSSVTITISTGIKLVTVPDVTGKNVDEASRILKETGLKVETNYVYNGSVAKDNVIDQSLEAGSSQEEDSTIYLNISKGAQPQTTTKKKTTTKAGTTAKTTAKKTTQKTTKKTTKKTTQKTTKKTTKKPATTRTTTTTRKYTTTRPTF